MIKDQSGVARFGRLIKWEINLLLRSACYRFFMMQEFSCSFFFFLVMHDLFFLPKSLRFEIDFHCFIKITTTKTNKINCLWKYWNLPYNPLFYIRIIIDPDYEIRKIPDLNLFRKNGFNWKHALHKLLRFSPAKYRRISAPNARVVKEFEGFLLIFS